jgi:hypothetical protein
MPQIQYVVSVDLVVPISGISMQPHYDFGPFLGWDATAAFMDKVDRHPKWRVTDCNVLNGPRLFDSGQELSLEPP